MMSKRKRFNGLEFNYQIVGNKTVFLNRFTSIDEFLETDFPKNSNQFSPMPDTVVFNIHYKKKNLYKDEKLTVSKLKELLKFGFNGNTPKLIRKSTHSIDEVRDLVKDVMFEEDKRNAKVELDGDLIKGNSQRFQTFFTKGLKCSCCGIEGKYFAKEKTVNDVSYHLNLYAINDDGKEVLMTKDHVLPKSKGGKNHISNYQTMCIICNKAKGNIVEN